MRYYPSFLIAVFLFIPYVFSSSVEYVGKWKKTRRINTDIFFNQDAHAFPYDSDITNEMELLRPENIGIAQANSNYAITALSPLMINNNDIVTISFRVNQTLAKSSDWIGAYSPANANISEVVPVKFSYCDLNSSYLLTGVGSLTFNFTNLRSDIAFYLFSNDLENPILQDRAQATVSFKNPNEPLKPRVVPTGDAGTLLLLWSSKNSSMPKMMWGTTSKIYPHVTSANTTTLPRHKLCGNPANASGWFDLGFIHTAAFRDLRSVSSLYIYYKFGDAATGDWSSEFKLRVPPLAGKQPSDRPTQVLLFDDMGRGSLDMSYTWNEWGRPAVYTAMATAADVQNGIVDAVYLGGDLSYADGYLSSWDFFLNMISPVTSGAVFMSTMGNHESAWPDSPSYFETVTSSGGECGWPTSTLFPSPFPAKNDKPWWSYDIGLIHLVGMSTEHNFTIDSPQWFWLKNDLANVDRAVTPWIIFGGHRAMYLNSWVNIGEASDVSVAAMLLANIEPLLHEYKVDVGFYGHNHVYQRHSAVYQNRVVQKSTQTIDSEANTVYMHKDPNATIHMVVGSAGALFTKTAIDPPPDWNELYIYEYGYVRARAVSASRLEWEFISSESNKILDCMVIIQSSRDLASSPARSTSELSTGEEAAIGICVSLVFIAVVLIYYFRYIRDDKKDKSLASKESSGGPRVMKSSSPRNSSAL